MQDGKIEKSYSHLYKIDVSQKKNKDVIKKIQNGQVKEYSNGNKHRSLSFR